MTLAHKEQHKLVAEFRRISTAHKALGNYYVEWESKVFSTMERLCSEYKGAYWDMYTFGDGGLFVVPRSAQGNSWHMENSDNYSSETMSDISAGITVCLYAYGYMAAKYYEQTDLFTEHYHMLREFFSTLPEEEREKIFRLTD